MTSGQAFAVFFVLALLSFVGFMPRAGKQAFAAIEEFGILLAKRKRLAVLAAAASAILLRVAILPVSPVPVPEYGDEFSYLLAADTFAHGRLTTPPHSLWLYFDTLHVNQHPTYMSKYPPAQGFALALGQILGHPWIGSLLSVAAMIAGFVWALQGWVPPPWAFLGGVLLFLRLGLFGYWINGYWGGAVAATGGALVLGALPRIIHQRRTRDAVILALGIAILANSRPFEGLIFSVPVLAVILASLLRRPNLPWRETFPRVVVPFCAVMLLCGIFMAWYNWRGTGNPLLLPYTAYDRTYMNNSPALLWQKPAPAVHYTNAQFEAFFNGWNHDTWKQGRADSIGKAVRVFGRDAGRFVRFFLWPELCVPFLALFWILRDRRMRLPVLQATICFGGFVLVAWFNPHYAAPVLAAVFLLLIQGLRHLRKFVCRGRPVGIGLSRAVVVSAVLLAPFHAVEFPKPGVAGRARIEAELEKQPGKQVVIVRYSPEHNSQAEWVYNRADIDNSKVVWARDMPGIALEPLLSYFNDRHVWIVDADSRRPEAQPYNAPPGY